MGKKDIKPIKIKCSHCGKKYDIMKYGFHPCNNRGIIKIK